MSMPVISCPSLLCDTSAHILQSVSNPGSLAFFFFLFILFIFFLSPAAAHGLCSVAFCVCGRSSLYMRGLRHIWHISLSRPCFLSTTAQHTSRSFMFIHTWTFPLFAYLSRHRASGCLYNIISLLPLISQIVRASAFNRNSSLLSSSAFPLAPPSVSAHFSRTFFSLIVRLLSVV